MRRTISLIIAIVLILVTLGILTLASASSANDDATYFVKRQLMWLALTFCGAAVTARFDYRRYRQLAIPISVFSILLLILARTPGIGHAAKGSWRWIKVGGISFQPSELAKIAVIILFSWWLSRSQRRIDELKRGIAIPFALLACFVLPIISEPDFGTTMLISLVAICMMFLGGVSIAPLMLLGVTGLVTVVTIIFQFKERVSRILAFLDPEAHIDGKGWQLVNSLQAFAGGELFGVGFGNSMQKYSWLPEAHTDFIFPIVAEELGLIASLLVIAMYMALFGLGMNIAYRARDDFGRFLAMGITLMITMQALINFAVVSGCVPTKGLALPFISYGGSSLLVSGVMVGILVNVAHISLRPARAGSRNPFKDRVRKV